MSPFSTKKTWDGIKESNISSQVRAGMTSPRVWRIFPGSRDEKEDSSLRGSLTVSSSEERGIGILIIRGLYYDYFLWMIMTLRMEVFCIHNASSPSSPRLLGSQPAVHCTTPRLIPEELILNSRVHPSPFPSICIFGASLVEEQYASFIFRYVANLAGGNGEGKDDDCFGQFWRKIAPSKPLLHLFPFEEQWIR